MSDLLHMMERTEKNNEAVLIFSLVSRVVGNKEHKAHAFTDLFCNGKPCSGRRRQERKMLARKRLARKRPARRRLARRRLAKRRERSLGLEMMATTNRWFVALAKRRPW